MDKTWGIFNLSENLIFFKQIGDLRVWINKNYKEISIASTYTGDKPGLETLQRPENAAWSRWLMREETKSIEISPLFPNRPVVVKMEEPLYMPENTGEMVFINVPVWMAIHSTCKEKILLLETPSQVLSNTWFGNFESGELCYWLSSSAQLSIEPGSGRPNMAVCPVYLSNRSDENLLVENFYLPLPNLTLFSNEDRLWSDEVALNYKGENEVGQVLFTGKPLKNLSNTRKIADPRQIEKKNILLKSFSSISSIWGSNMQQ